jgi:hypothetical protein
MKKVLLFVIVAGAGGWWYFIGGRNLTEDHVNAFYDKLQTATLDRKPDDLCALLADNFESSGTVEVGGRKSPPQTQNREQTCEAYAKLYDQFDKMGDKMGGIMQLDSNYEIHSISITPDKKSASVDMSYSLDVGGSIMHIRSRSTDVLIRRNGKVMMLRSDGDGRIWTGS